MNTSTNTTTLFLDIGGVLLSNGWDRHTRQAAAQRFGLELDDLDERHHLIFDAYEKGRLSLTDYLDQVVFYRPRRFSHDSFREFMFDQSRADPDMLALIRQLKTRYRLRTVAVSNEGRELNEHRIRSFGLTELIDFFVSSCYIHCRKPDPAIYRMALDMSQVPPQQVFYIDDREMFVAAAAELRIDGICHRSMTTTQSALADRGLTLGKARPEEPPA